MLDLVSSLPDFIRFFVHFNHQINLTTNLSNVSHYFTLSKVRASSCEPYIPIIKELTYLDEETKLKMNPTLCESRGRADTRKAKQKLDQNHNFSHVRLPSDARGRGGGGGREE